MRVGFFSSARGVIKTALRAHLTGVDTGGSLEKERGLVRLLAAVVMVVCVLSVGAANAAAGDAPYLEKIASVLRQRSPGTEGNVWWLRDGNELPTPTASSPGWLLQTLNCWGQNPCSKPPNFGTG